MEGVIFSVHGQQVGSCPTSLRHRNEGAQVPHDSRQTDFPKPLHEASSFFTFLLSGSDGLSGTLVFSLGPVESTVSECYD